MATPISQLITEIRGDINEYTPMVFRDTDLLVWINDGIQAVASEVHGMMEDWLTRRLKSTDASETIQGTSYAPSSLKIVGGTDTYSLPPNLVQIRTLEPLTASDRQSGLTFIPRTHAHPEFLRLTRLTAQSSQLVYYYALYGPQTLRIAPTPASGVSIDVELWYVALPARLTLSGSISELPLQAMKAVKAYAGWRAMQSINSPDVNAKLIVYQTEVKELNALSSPRQTNDPVFVEGAFDEEDYPDTTNY